VEVENLSDEEEKRSVRDLMSCQEGRSENSNWQVGNEERSVEDLINCQEGRGEIPDFQVGKGNEMRLSKSIRSSEMSSGQQGVLAMRRRRGQERCLMSIRVHVGL
jgi:hypothetical protein